MEAVREKRKKNENKSNSFVKPIDINDENKMENLKNEEPLSKNIHKEQKEFDHKSEYNETSAVSCSDPEPSTSNNGSFDDFLKEKLIDGTALIDEDLSINRDVSEITIKEQISPEQYRIKPFTEEQLTALYTNTELNTLSSFTDQFVEAELKGIAVKQHYLYDLLKNYHRIREQITGNNLELDQFRKEYHTLQNDLWSIYNAEVNGKAECQDKVSVTASHTYHKSIFHRSVFQSIVRILGNIQKLVFENHVLNSYAVEDLRLQIELYIQTVCSNCINITQLQPNAKVALHMSTEPVHLQPHFGELRLSISVLFAFQRKLIRDKKFIKDTREWLSKLVAILLRVANYQDHLFIANQILRCPSGVGNWASGYVQIVLDEIKENESPFANYQINHLTTILALILSPVPKRDLFLREIAQVDETATEALWVIIDSEGEEDEEHVGVSLRENDLVSLLNQLPLDNLFRSILLIKKRNFLDVYDPNSLSDHHVLRFFSFCTSLLRIFYQGLKTYQQPRYNQFCKRLSRLIRHVTQYATDQWEIFKNVNFTKDLAMIEKIQVEYDAFFLRAIYYLYSSQKLGAWQFLAVIPYHLVSLPTLWKIFYFLHSSDMVAAEILNPLDRNDYNKMLWDLELRGQFEEKVNNLSDAESYYLLNTFANMALARADLDMEFIETVILDLLQIGYVNEPTQDSCSKSVKILLSHITSKYPHLLTNVLIKVKDNMSTIKELALYIYEELPLTIWKIKEYDFQLISKLLLNNPITSTESKLARMILSRLNWDIIPHEIHCKTAILAVEAVDREAGYMQWSWQIIFRLKLHLHEKICKNFSDIPELEKFQVLVNGVREQKPLAAFVSIIMTSWGHAVPLVCSKGMAQLLLLQANQKHEAVLFALYVMLPLFINSQECLINSEQFQEVLVNLLKTDRSYISMAKSLISGQNTILEQFGNMIVTQVVNFADYDLDSPKCLIRLWILSFISIPNWNKDFGIIYLLDVLIRTAFFHKDALDAAYNIFTDLAQCTMPQEVSGTISFLFKWGSSTNPSLISSSMASHTYLAYMVIEIEHIERELKTGLWKELLAQLNNQKGKVNVDQALKKACSVHKLPNVSSSSLCIYRWSQQAMDTPIGHPLLPLIWQKFFNLYLARLPGSSFVDKACIGEKFFDGLVNFAHFKKIKKRLQETVEYYDNLDDIEKNNEFYLMLKRIFGAFLLWLEEPRLQESNVLLSSLPLQYESSLLGQILQGINTPWFEFIDYDQMKKIQEDSLKIWKISNFRLKNNVNLPLPSPGKSMESLDPIERILRRISSYDQPTPPPPITQNGSIVSALNFATKEDMFRSLEGPFKCLMQFAHNHVLKISEQKALDCSYQELIPQLYRSVLNKVAEKVSCKGRNQTAHCSGAATIILEMEEAKINERIDHQIQSNRITYESLLTKSLQEPARSLCVASVTLQQAIRVLQQQLNCNPSSSELGVELFYYILSLMSEETLTYPPTKSLFSTCIERLGQSHISNVEIQMPRLLQKILNEPKFGGYLAPHFSPSKVGTAYLLSMYSTIAEEIGQKYDVAFALLSKFDIDTWLKNRGPKLSERSQFIQTVIRALTLLGYDPPVQALGLHDLYKKHLIAVFEHQFPEHYGEVIVLLLKASNANVDANLLAISVWMEILNSLSQPVQLNIKLFLRDQLRQYAQRQKVLQHQVLLETAELLARHFTNERLKYGLYGLYPKCRNYMDVFILYIGMTGHALVISSLNAYQGKLDNELCNKIWPMLRDMFAPWLVPYSMQNLKENMASWIQQLADDRSVLLPWIPADGSFAQKVVDVFFECVQFLILTLPACNNILSNIWQWYVTSFAHPSVKDYILYPIHQTFLSFQWHNFWPSIMDIELMLKVVDQYLPECHMFLGHIFMAIPWNNWLLNFTNAPPELKQRVYQCFFNLLIKLSTEPNVRNRYAENAKTLLVQAENFEWSNLETAVYQYVMDWYVLSCDSSVIFKSDPLNLDYRVLHFLKIVGGWSKNMTSNNTVQMKRLIYIRSFIKLVSVYTSKYKTNLGNKETEIKLIILRLLNKMEEIVENDDELILDLEEVLHVLNIANIDEISFQAVSQWIKKHSGNTNITTALLKNAGKSIKKLDLLARTVETTVTSYFQASGIRAEGPYPQMKDCPSRDNPRATWKHVTENCNVVLTKRNELEEICIENDCILTLHIVFLQRIHLCNEPAFLAKEALSWVTNININNDTECKIYLIWFGILHLCIQNCHRDVTITAAILNKFAQLLIQIAEDKGSSWGRGLLSAIGITKQGISLNFRFLCRALAGYILAQLPEMKGGSRTIRFSENAPCKVGQSGGNTDCVKLLLSLDFGHSQGTIKECAELALNQIQDPKNSLHNANKFLFLLVRQFHLETYIQDIF